MIEPKAYQIVIHNHDEENPSVQMRFRDGHRYVGTHHKYVADMVSDGYITQDESFQVETILRKMVDAEREFNPISVDDLVIAPVGIS